MKSFSLLTPLAHSGTRSRQHSSGQSAKQHSTSTSARQNHSASTTNVRREIVERHDLSVADVP